MDGVASLMAEDSCDRFLFSFTLYSDLDQHSFFEFLFILSIIFLSLELVSVSLGRQWCGRMSSVTRVKMVWLDLTSCTVVGGLEERVTNVMQI